MTRRGRAAATGPAPTERLRVDPVACAGVAICARVASDLVDLDRWGFPVLASGALGAGEREAARRAVAACPRRALWLDVADVDDR